MSNFDSALNAPEASVAPARGLQSTGGAPDGKPLRLIVLGGCSNLHSLLAQHLGDSVQVVDLEELNDAELKELRIHDGAHQAGPRLSLVDDAGLGAAALRKALSAFAEADIRLLSSFQAAEPVSRPAWVSPYGPAAVGKRRDASKSQGKRSFRSR